MHLIIIIIIILITLVPLVMIIWNNFPDIIPSVITICLKNVKTGAKKEENNSG